MTTFGNAQAVTPNKKLEYPEDIPHLANVLGFAIW
jgi:hypothetical protein